LPLIKKINNNKFAIFRNGIFKYINKLKNYKYKINVFGIDSKVTIWKRVIEMIKKSLRNSDIAS
tara:strand:- start:209 stop:400 length:192 start_codon:yes stop_codon:yes gene_type:complete